MINRQFTITAFLFFCFLPLIAQEKKQDAAVKREVTLYNPYKPTLTEAKKKSFLPDMRDTTKIKPQFNYDVNTTPFMPIYTVSPIKAAALLPDPLIKLYRSYVNIGLGNNFSPLAEISITNERSKKGTLGFYGRHFSNNGKLDLQNGKRIFAGYMDNDVSLFGRKFFRSNVLGGSVDLVQKSRFAYGYDPAFLDYSPGKKEIRNSYSNIGAIISLSSLTLDSTKFSYDFDLRYNYFYNTRNLFQNNFGFTGYMAKSFKGFYAGAGLEYDYYNIPYWLLEWPKYVTSVNPFIKKSTELWNFKIGFQAVLERNLSKTATLHLYPNIDFGFSIVPSYIGFFTGLSGKLEKNDPLKVISENPFIVRDGSLLTMPNTDHELIVTAGLKGNTGLGGNYILSASYSLISDMALYSNIVYPDSLFISYRGNYFATLTDEVDLLNIHGEMSGKVTDKITYYGTFDYYKYTLTTYDYAWNKPDWDGKLGIKYNLRDKIIAGMQISAQSKRKLIVNGKNINLISDENPPVIIEMPYNVNLNFSAEYRYSKILSLWTKFNNISYKRYYEWAYYPSQRFLFMLGFTYSL